MDKSRTLKSFTDSSANVYNGKSKFELINCPRNGKNCKTHLLEINRNYSDSDYFYQNKEYQESIEALNAAFSKTFELNEDICSNCAKLFRCTIVQSLQNIHLELHKLSTGFFKKNDYKSSYILADSTLNSLIKNID
ncbi:MAG TPA: hypothetical protein VKA38_11505 [Draconibacterium sp.]|nr:hypothetical protein [Draconibacterium sp.]